MINKIKSMDKKKMVLSLIAFVLVLIIVVLCCISKKESTDRQIVYVGTDNIEVTDKEMEEYRNRITDDMSIKKAVLILFEDEASCNDFILNHGADAHPEDAGEGIVPLMENGYYNITGNQVLEEVFDKLENGDYSKQPILYSNMFCYLKRLEEYSIKNDDNALKKMIQNDKYQQMRKEGE